MCPFITFSRKRLQPDWQHRFQGTVWRLLISSDGKIVVGEERDTAGKRVNYFAVEIQSGVLLWNIPTPDGSWWAGLEDVTHDTVYVHSYVSPDMPGHKGLQALDLKTGAIRWENKELRYLFARGDHLWCDLGFEGSVVPAEFDSKSGMLIRRLSEEESHMLISVPHNSPGSQPGLPAKVESNGSVQSHPAHRVLSSVMEKRDNLAYLEYCESHGHLVVSGYATSSSHSVGMSYSQHIAVANICDLRTCYHDIIMKDAVAIVPEGFFILDTKVMYIRDKKELVCLPLANRS